MKRAVELMCVPPSMAGEVWPKVGHFLVAAARRGGLHLPEVVARLPTGDALLWVAVEGDAFAAAAITQLERGDDGTSCRLVAAGGIGAAGWVHLIDGIEAYARAEGCVRMRFEGRHGWRRHLPDYQVPRAVFEKDIR
ncbi:hypothetical protein [Xanthobacter versatilis]|uniref:hypothetical protein n=1 Tax=Xanthobacter autotrophicus (strain ATCC BAA-1158 / Py2) TaxID=78245 RepID=UPI003729BB61